MSYQGLQVFNENGNIEVDITSKLCKYLGKGYTGFDAGSLSDTSLSTEGTLWVMATGIVFNKTLQVASWTSINYARPIFTKSDGKLSWSFLGVSDYGVKASYYFIYGIY